MRLPLVTVLIALLVAGCAAPENAAVVEGDPAIPTTFCARQHLEMTPDGEVAVCDALHPEPPLLRLPTAGTARAYAVSDGVKFSTREGTTYVIPAELETSEAVRAASAVYELTLAGPAVTGVRRVLVIPEAAFVETLLGKRLEGWVSARAEEGRFDMDASLPVQLVIAPQPASPPSDPARAYEIVATIANLATAVRSSDGECMAALSSHGDAATFSATSEVELRGYRHPSMHMMGDNTFVLEWRVDGVSIGSMMGRDWFVGPGDLARDPFAAPERFDGTGHGSPGSIPQLSVSTVGSGGEACTIDGAT